jgi:hypothetical protein
MVDEKTNVEKCLVLLNSSDKDKIKSGLELVKSFDEQQLVNLLLIYKMDDQGKLILDKNWSGIFCELLELLKQPVETVFSKLKVLQVDDFSIVFDTYEEFDHSSISNGFLYQGFVKLLQLGSLQTLDLSHSSHHDGTHYDEQTYNAASDDELNYFMIDSDSTLSALRKKFPNIQIECSLTCDYCGVTINRYSIDDKRYLGDIIYWHGLDNISDDYPIDEGLYCIQCQNGLELF